MENKIPSAQKLSQLKLTLIVVGATERNIFKYNDFGIFLYTTLSLKAENLL